MWRKKIKIPTVSWQSENHHWHFELFSSYETKMIQNQLDVEGNLTSFPGVGKEDPKLWTKGNKYSITEKDLQAVGVYLLTQSLLWSGQTSPMSIGKSLMGGGGKMHQSLEWSHMEDSITAPSKTKGTIGISPLGKCC